MSKLIMGGTGYIGSHTVVELLNAGEEVVIVDNLYNSKICVLDRIEHIPGIRPVFHKVDMLDKEGLSRVFDEHPDIDSVIHFAGLKAVGESVQMPLVYYRTNIMGTINLLECMKEHDVRRIVFSSSATVYGVPKMVPIREDFPLSTTNPYGQTKLVIERILADYAASWDQMSVINLRYFNPIGAHESGLIGEDPKGIPNNLLPYVARVAVGKLPRVTVHGNDYPTRDGTGVRDYIHVVDLAKAHLCALKRTENMLGTEYINIGTGNGYSVLEVIEAFGQAWGSDIPYVIGPRRAGDIAECYADASLAKELLGWEAQYDIAKMCQDSARWQKQNPDGYPD